MCIPFRFSPLTASLSQQSPLLLPRILDQVFMVHCGLHINLSLSLSATFEKKNLFLSPILFGDDIMTTFNSSCSRFHHAVKGWEFLMLLRVAAYNFERRCRKTGPRGWLNAKHQPHVIWSVGSSDPWYCNHSIKADKQRDACEPHIFLVWFNFIIKHPNLLIQK